jgi:hypothetical protein
MLLLVGRRLDDQQSSTASLMVSLAAAGRIRLAEPFVRLALWNQVDRCFIEVFQPSWVLQDESFEAHWHMLTELPYQDITYNCRSLKWSRGEGGGVSVLR